MTDVGTEIARARRARNWSQTQLAEELGVSRDAVSKWERGLVKEPRGLERALQLLGIPEQPNTLTDTAGSASSDLAQATEAQLIARAQVILAELASRAANTADTAGSGGQRPSRAPFGISGIPSATDQPDRTGSDPR